MAISRCIYSMTGAEEYDVYEEEVIPVEEQPIVLADGEIAAAEVVIAEHEQEITEVQNDINLIEERLEDIEENLEGLESMLTGAESWNPALALKMYNDACKLTVRTFGETRGAPSVSGVESFADASTAKLVMIDGIEALKTRAKDAGAFVVQFFKNLYKSVIAAFVGLFDRLKGIEKRADILVGRLNDTTDDKLKTTIALGSWNAYLEVDKDPHVGEKIVGYVNIIKGVGNALNATKGEDAEKIIEKTLNDFASRVKGKKQVNSGADESNFSGKIGGIMFEWTVPRTLKALRSAKLKYSVSNDAKTEGEIKSNMAKTALIGLLNQTKFIAGEARNTTYSASKLNGIRDRAVAVVQAASLKEETRDTAKALREAHSASTAIARTLTRYQGDLLIATQKYVSAHI